MEQYRDIKKDGFPDLNTTVEVWIEENEMPFQAGWRDDGLGPCWHSESYEVQENKDNIRYWRPIRLDRPGATPSPAKAEQEGLWIQVTDRMPEKDGRYKVRRQYTDDYEWAEFACHSFTNYVGYKVIEWFEPSTPPVNLPIEELIKLSDEELSEEIDKVRSRLGMGKRESAPAVEVAYDELWDEFSEHIDDDIDSLSMFAGRSVLTETQYNKLVTKLKAAPVKEAGQPAPSGLRWINAAVDIPQGNDNPIHVKVDGCTRIGNFYEENGVMHFHVQHPHSYSLHHTQFKRIEWLSDSPAPVQVDPVPFAEPICENALQNMGFEKEAGYSGFMRIAVDEQNDLRVSLNPVYVSYGRRGGTADILRYMHVRLMTDIEVIYFQHTGKSLQKQP